jgi:hypothetical protein
MNNKPRRRATKSRHRVTMAAGAILAGAAIPLATAGTAWADDTVTQTTTDKMETVQELEKQGLSTSQANAVFAAEQPGGTPVEVSVDGKEVVVENQGGTAETDATARSGTGDFSVAIGGGTDSSAHGTAASAFVVGATPEDNSDHANALGRGASASVIGATDSRAGAAGIAAIATVDNTDPVGTASHDVATAIGVKSDAVVANLGLAGDVTDDEASAGRLATATVAEASDSTARAAGEASIAVVTGTPVTYITDSSAEETQGGNTTVTTSDTHERNGIPVSQVEMRLPTQLEMTPLTDVHEMHVMPAMPMP